MDKNFKIPSNATEFFKLDTDKKIYSLYSYFLLNKLQIESLKSSLNLLASMLLEIDGEEIPKGKETFEAFKLTCAKILHDTKNEYITDLQILNLLEEIGGINPSE